jgi:hypothetical protein
MALATFGDLVAIGAIPDQTSAYDKYGVRATRLLELASGQALAYLGTTEVELLAVITAEQVTSLAAIVAECAGSRINRSAAPSSDGWTGSGYESALLNSWHKRQIDELIGRPGKGSVSFSVERDPVTSAVSTTGPRDVLDDSDWYRNQDGSWSQTDPLDGSVWQ